VQKLNPPPGTVVIISVSPTSDESTVVLNCAPMASNSQFRLQVANIADFATPPNFIVPGSFTMFPTGP